jgi:hypothetical protein
MSPAPARQEFPDVAVLVDNGMMVTPSNPFDLNGVTLRFEPAGDHRYTVSRAPAALDPDFGPALTFGVPGIPFPGDDDSQQIGFSAGFPFFGTTYASAHVNADGNVTLGAPEFASDDRDKAKHLLGPPRISGFLADWSPQNALNPGGQGSVHAVAKSGPHRLVVTWNEVLDFNNGGSSTFQLVLYASGVVEIALVEIDAVSKYGVVGLAAGGGQRPFQIVDFVAQPSPTTLAGGAVLEAFAELTQVHYQRVAQEFYRTHPDRFDLLTIMTDFPADAIISAEAVSNQTHGIGTQIDPGTGAPVFPNTVYDRSSAYGSAGELEMLVFMNNVRMMPENPEHLVNPPIVPYDPSLNLFTFFEQFGGPVSLDGQSVRRARLVGNLPEDTGEWVGRYFPTSGPYSLGPYDLIAIMTHEVLHRWAAYLAFVHPTKGVGFESFDLLGRGAAHWSFFLNTAVPASQFGETPRFSVMHGNVIRDLGRLRSYNGTPVHLDPGERVFATPVDQLADGYSELDQYLMGLRRASEVSPFFYVDEPVSIFTGQSLDQFDPANVTNTAVTMRGWSAIEGMVFKGHRVDLRVKDIAGFEAIREGPENPRGTRFWGPTGNLTLRYFGDSRRVDPNGDATVVLTERHRELGDEADLIDQNQKPVDVKTTAFVLVVQAGPADPAAVSLADTFRRTWQTYVNGPATGGRGKFDTRLNPPIY